MSRSTHFATWTLGPIALLALAGGCSPQRPQPVAPQPQVSETRTTPPEAQPQVRPPPAIDRPMGQEPMGPGAEPHAVPPGAGPERPEPPAQPPPMGATPGDTGVQSERDMCDALAHDAKISVEDIQGGVAFVLKIAEGGDMETVHKDARKIESAWPSGATPMSGGATCEIFDLGRQGAKIAVTESATAVRVHITTADPGQVKTVRKQAREFAKTAKEAAPSRGRMHP